MSRVWTIATREYASFFRVPLGWVVVALFLALSGAVFSGRGFGPGQPATMRAFFETWWTLLVIVAPAISMRLFSDELRTGTIEPLLTAPVAEAAVVVGKYVGSVLFLLTLLAPTLLYVILLFAISRPDAGPIIAGYAGVILLGMLYLAVGCLASSLTSSQTLAFLGTFFALFIFEIMALVVAPAAPAGIRSFLYSLSVNQRMGDFARGLIDTGHVVFFLAASAWFLALASVVMESRRWR
jgi:ABC-2 type transport system permease protein